MEFDEIVVKDTPGLCRCCLSEGCYKDLSTEYTWMDEREIYADMLLECFDISISQHVDGPNGPNRLICEVCITRLRDACNFKKQVLDSEKKFVDMVGRRAFKETEVTIYLEQMKSEAGAELQPLQETEIEYLDDDVMDYDMEVNKEEPEPTVSEDVLVATLPIKGKRGRPKKTAVKPEKKKAEKRKLKVEDKPKTKTAKGHNRQESPETATEAENKSSNTLISATKRNRLMKKNATILLESSTVVPFKWHRHNFLCFFCHRTFKTMQPLKEHTRNDHKTSSVKSAVSYLKRDEKVKIDVSNITCRICNATLDDMTALIEHLKIRHDVKLNGDTDLGFVPYIITDNGHKCALCKKDFEYFLKLNQHMNDHFGNYVCEVCGKSFLSQDRLRCHNMSHGAAFRCSICPEIFDSLTQRSNHESIVHDKRKSIRCCFCSEMFASYLERKKHHIAIHYVEVDMSKCPVCGKSFHIKSKMHAHIKEVHDKERNFPCSLCDQRFFSKTQVQKHMIKHVGEKIHQCQVCKKSYARKQTLRDHMRIHTNDRRYVCTLCRQAFLQNNSLQLHMTVHHPNYTKS